MLSQIMYVVSPTLDQMARREDWSIPGRKIFRDPLLSVYVSLSQEKNG